METLKKVRLILFFVFNTTVQCQIHAANFTEFLFGSSAITNTMIAKFGANLEVLSQALIDRHQTASLEIFDGSDGANQCHINALMVVMLTQGLHILTEENKSRFLALNLLLHLREKVSAFLSVKISSKLNDTLQSGESRLIKQAKQELLKIKQCFFALWLSPFINNKGWRELAFESHGTSILPKFVGIWCLLEFLKKNQTIWTVIKCKDFSGKLVANSLITPNQKEIISAEKFLPQSTTPVIVIEGITANLEVFSTLNPEQLQLANAAAWMKKNQPQAIDGLPDQLRKSFEDALCCAEEFKVGPQAEEENNASFSIQHMFPDRLGHAIELIFEKRHSSQSD